MNQPHIDELRRARGWSLVKRFMGNGQRLGDQWLATLGDLVKRQGTGFLVAMLGPWGRGKTQLGIDLMMDYTTKGLTAEYSSALGFFLEIKATYDRDPDNTELEVMKSFVRPRLLVVDEFEKRSDNEWANRLLFELINRRYGTMRDTLLISNLNSEQFSTFIGPSLASRMNETGGIIVCNWKGFRG